MKFFYGKVLNVFRLFVHAGEFSNFAESCRGAGIPEEIRECLHVFPMAVLGMLAYKKIELSDREWVNELLAYSDFRGTEYSFATLYIWAGVFNTRICRWNDFLVARSCDGKDAAYIFPAGRGSDAELAELMGLLEKDAEEAGLGFSMVSITGDSARRIESACGNRYDFVPLRNSFDYVYETEALINLSGKKYQPKRNHMARFKELNWAYEPVSLSNIADCAAMNEEWCRVNGCGRDLSMQQESCAVRKALENFGPLSLKGGLLRVDGKVVAYALGEKINSDTFIVHVEKAFGEYKGAYQMINREFLVHEASGCRYVNREDDAGDEGLRKAKLSYHPAFMIEKYMAVRKSGCGKRAGAMNNM